MLWKPEEGATATFDEFVRARTLMLEIHDDMLWNSWRRNERAEELQDATDVFGQWNRAEPDFRPMTYDEVKSWMAEWEADYNAGREDADRQRQARIPQYDEAREQARLELLECEAALRRATADRDGHVDGTLYPRMDPERRTGEIARIEDEVASRAGKVAELRKAVGDPETVVDRLGRLPGERRELSLVYFSCWRNTEVPRLRTLVAELQTRLAGTTERGDRTTIRNELNRESQRMEAIAVIPRLGVPEMCSECATPLSWHEEFRLTLAETGPCPAWPNWAMRIKAARDMLMRASQRQEPTPPKPKPIAVIPSGIPITDVISRLAEIQAEHPGAVVRRGSANKWEVWPPKQLG